MLHTQHDAHYTLHPEPNTMHPFPCTCLPFFSQSALCSMSPSSVPLGWVRREARGCGTVCVLFWDQGWGCLEWWIQAVFVVEQSCWSKYDLKYVCVCVQEDDAAEAQGREEASDRRLQQLQTALGQLESRYVTQLPPPLPLRNYTLKGQRLISSWYCPGSRAQTKTLSAFLVRPWWFLLVVTVLQQ